MTTIILTVSRSDYLEQVVSRIELLECDPTQVNILAIVDGDDALYIKVRNRIQLTKFENRLVVRSDLPTLPPRYDLLERRNRIATIHNQARGLIAHTNGYVFCVEDDTIIPRRSLERLMKIAINNSAFAFAEGVEIGRWGVPYVGAWRADDIYEPTKIVSVQNIYPVAESQRIENIDGGGLYCALIRADLYKDHEFHASNGLGPDVNFGLAMRQQGFECFIDWNIPCTHLYNQMGVEYQLGPSAESKVVTLTKVNDKKWRSSY